MPGGHGGGKGKPLHLRSGTELWWDVVLPPLFVAILWVLPFRDNVQIAAWRAWVGHSLMACLMLIAWFVASHPSWRELRRRKS